MLISIGKERIYESQMRTRQSGFYNVVHNEELLCRAAISKLLAMGAGFVEDIFSMGCMCDGFGFTHLPAAHLQLCGPAPNRP